MNPDHRIAAKRKVLGELRDYMRAGTAKEMKERFYPAPRPSAQAPERTASAEPAPEPSVEDLEAALRSYGGE